MADNFTDPPVTRESGDCMITKILSGGYNDVERGALDFAAAGGIACGGWTPIGWLEKIGRAETARFLQEVPHSGSPNYAERNILDADGTLLITQGPPRGGAELAANFAARYRRPLIHIDLAGISRFQAARNVEEWMAQNAIEVLNITGGGRHPTVDLRQVTVDVLQTIVRIAQVKAATARAGGSPVHRRVVPGTIDEAVTTLASLLPLEERIRIGRMPSRQLPELYAHLGPYISESLGWWHNNDALIHSCRSAGAGAGTQKLTPDEILIRHLWEQLNKRHGLRRVK